MKFNCKQCTECCGPVPLTKPELAVIKQAISVMSREERERIKGQPRELLTCVLLDTENKRCSVYSYRPLICRQYGQIRELKCPNNQGLRLRSGQKESMQIGRYNIAGIMSMTIGWNELGVKV